MTPSNTSNIPDTWHGKPYYSLDAYCKNTFHHKCYKIALNAHMTCPNRDGLLDTRGCIFCSAGGSGDFAVSMDEGDIDRQLQKGISLFGSKEHGNHFIAYFQAYTNTYAPVDYLENVYVQALDHPDVCGISIATRPDCLPDEVLILLSRLKNDYPDKFIWIELGLQTVLENTALWLRRGYPLSCFDEACRKLDQIGIPVIVHTILGLPGEDLAQALETIHYLNRIKPFGIKLQLLHILKGTDLALLYQTGQCKALTKEEYLHLVTECLCALSPDIVVHRVTGDGPKTLLIAPQWSANKRDVLNSLHQYMRMHQLYQGKKYLPETTLSNNQFL